jgi:hypothetical protein
MGAPKEAPDDPVKQLDAWVKLWYETNGDEGISPEDRAAALKQRPWEQDVDAGTPDAGVVTDVESDEPVLTAGPPTPPPGTRPPPPASSLAKEEEAYATGTSTVTSRPAPVEKSAGELMKEYKTPEPYVRPSNHVPGHPAGPMQDGSWWDSMVRNVPQVLRDQILNAGVMPSQSPVYIEPSDEEAIAGVTAEAEAQGLRPKTSYPYLQAWKDKQYALAYDDAQKRGDPIYRGRDIDENSPGFMQTAKWTSDALRSSESFLRGVDEAALFGTVGNAIDEEKVTRGIPAFYRHSLETVGIPPPAFLGSDEEDQAAIRHNMTQGERVVAENPGWNFAGNVAGSLVPEGAGNMVGKLVGKGMKGLSPGRGMISGMARGGVEAGVTGAAENLATSELRNDVRAEAGLEEVPLTYQLEGAAEAGLMSAGLGTVLSAPKGIARGLREDNDATSAYHNRLEKGTDESSTQFANWKGLRAPEGHEELVQRYPEEGSYQGAKHEAVQAAADDLMPATKLAQDVAGDTSDQLTSSFADQHDNWVRDVKATADFLVPDQTKTALKTEEGVRRFTERVMNFVDAKKVERMDRHASELGGVRQQLGVPEAPPIPGPDMMIGEIAAARATKAQGDYGLTTDYPSVSTQPIIDEHFRIAQSLAFDDGAHMPSATHQKFKEAVDSLFTEKVVDAKEASLYNNVALDMRVTKEGMVRVKFARKVHARELGDIIQAFDEMSKYADNTADPNAARYKGLGAVARDLRESAFKLEADLKGRQHLEILDNEAMLRSIGLEKNVANVTPGDVDQATTVLSNIKGMLKDEHIKTPGGLALPRQEFERWLYDQDPDGLFNEYMVLRDLTTQSERAASFDITVGALPRTQSEAFKSLEDGITGRDRDAEAVVGSFKNVRQQVEQMRVQQKHRRDIFDVLGMGQNFETMSADTRKKMQITMNQVLLEGGPKFDRLRELVTPEQRKLMDTARQAAGDVDTMFRTLGFGPDDKLPGFDKVKRQEVVQGLHKVFEKFEKYGENIDFDRSVREIFKDSPNVRKALTRMSKERAFQWLRNDFKGMSKEMGGASRPFHAFLSDFFQNHLDSMTNYQSSKQNALNPFDVPTPYALGIMNTSEDEPMTSEWTQTPQESGGRDLGYGSDLMSGPAPREPMIARLSVVKAMNALMRAVDLIDAEEKP